MIKSKNILLFFVLLLLADIGYAKFYRWVDKNGKVHYSDKLPPEQARGAHDQIKSDGVAIDSVDRDKTDSERQAEKIAAEQKTAERKQKAAKEARQRAKDKILLDIFSSEDDLLYTREDRLTAIESLINLTKLNNKRLTERLKVSTATQERLLKANSKVPKTITDSIQSTQNQIDKNNAYIQSQQATYQKIDNEFAADLKRYRELKNIQPKADTPTNTESKLDSSKTALPKLKPKS